MAVMEAGAQGDSNSEGNRTTPSIVAFSKTGKELLDSCQAAGCNQSSEHYFSAKRLIGRKFDEIKEEVGTLPFKVIEGKNGATVIECDIDGKTETFMPEQIASMVWQN